MAKYKVKAPNESYFGVSAGVTFENGVGITESPDALGWFTRKGYAIEEVVESDPANETELAQKSVKALKAYVEEKGFLIEGYKSMNKDALIAAIEAAAQDQVPDPDPEKSGAADPDKTGDDNTDDQGGADE